MGLLSGCTHSRETSIICLICMLNAEYGDDKAEISFEGEVLAGKMRADRLHMVQAWIHIHHDELVADWNIALSGEKVFRIDPLR